jgi:di/tripeptidase
MYVDGDWVRAHGTTLGADNGLGVAAIMAILESTDIPHPAIEALFTDEETGMTGALNLKEESCKVKSLKWIRKKMMKSTLVVLRN